MIFGLGLPARWRGRPQARQALEAPAAQRGRWASPGPREAHAFLWGRRNSVWTESSCCSSLFTYCTQALHLSEHAAYGRIEAARAARKFPIILERLGEGSVTLTTVGLLAAHLTPENHRELLDAARHKSKRQVEALVARLHPQPPVPASIRKLPAVSPRPARPPALAEAAALPGAAASPQPAGDAQAVASPSLASPAPAPPPPRQGVVAPLAPERY